jgi:sideroflexin-5
MPISFKNLLNFNTNYSTAETTINLNIHDRNDVRSSSSFQKRYYNPTSSPSRSQPSKHFTGTATTSTATTLTSNIPILASREKFDMSNMFERLKYFWQITSLSTLFATRDEINKACTVHFKPSSHTHLPLSKRWECERLVSATLHPETKEYVYVPFRRSAFVAVNIPIYVGMLMSPQTRGWIVFWQWLNQTYNCGMNYYNRSGTEIKTIPQLLPSYTMAVSASCFMGLGAKFLTNMLTISNPVVRAAALGFVPFCGSASAGVLNVLVTRKDEYFDGIAVRETPHGQGPTIGFSREAGRIALRDTGFSRVLLIGIGTILPPITMSCLENMGLFRRFPRIRVPTYIGVIALSLRVALPMSLAPWYWFAPISLKDLELEIQEKIGSGDDENDSGGETVLYYNRGM